MRSKNAMRNVLANVFGQILILGLNFIARKIFLYVLDTNYLGISGLFTSVITMLSLAELGVGAAITFSLYKPLLNQDNELILSLMNLYKKVYRFIGILVLVVGCAITPIVMYLTVLETEIPHLELMYILFVINTSISYFYSYNRTLIVADQKEYRLAGIDYLSKIGLIFLQCAVLLLTKNYILYLIIQIIMTFLQNYLVYRKVRKLYPVIKSHDIKKLPEPVLAEIKKNTLAMMIYKLAGVIVSGTDNLIISKMLGIVWVGLYSNYSMIILSVQTICSKMISSVTASIGNVIAAGDKEHSYTIYEAMQYICFWVYGICSIELFVLLNPFIRLFFGEAYILPGATVLVVLINFYLLGMQGGTSVFREAQGIFWQGKLRPLVQGILNLVISIGLVLWMRNLTAVFLGTIISRILTITWYDPYAVHKHGFQDMKKLKTFTWKYFRYLLLVVAGGLLASWFAVYYNVDTIGCFIYKGIVTLVITGVVFLIGTFRMKEFHFLLKMGKQILRRNSNDQMEGK